MERLHARLGIGTKPVLLTLAALVVLLALGTGALRLGSPPRVIVTWETASQADTAAFHVYRSRSPDGPFSLISERPVPAEGDLLIGASYRYEDEDVAWGEQYFYQLEVVERDGARTRYPEVAEGRAGLAWPWAAVVGAALVALPLIATEVAVRFGRHLCQVRAGGG